MLVSVVVVRSATGAVAEVIVPFGLAKAGLFSGCPVVLGVVAASEEGSEDALYCPPPLSCGIVVGPPVPLRLPRVANRTGFATSLKSPSVYTVPRAKRALSRYSRTS